MNCKICGTDNPEDAVFCKACGKRLNDTAVCPECSATIPADSVFCPYCGVKQGKPQKREQTPAPEKVEADDKKPSAATAERNKKIFKTVLKYAAPSSALLTSLFALIFVFFTGYQKTAVMSTGSGVSGSKVGVDLFFYFGEAYKTLAKSFEELDFAQASYSDYFATVSYLPAILGTVIAALTLAAVCTLAIIALAQGIRCLLGKTQKTGGGLAIAAFLAYVAGAVALYSIDNCIIREVETVSSSQTLIVTSGCKLNGATVAGITLCAVFAFIYLAVGVASRGREMLAANSIAKWALSAAGLVVITVVIILCAQPAFSLDSDDNVLNEKLKVGATYLIAMLTLFCMDWDASEAVLNRNEATAYAAISFVMLIVTIALATRMLACFSQKVTEKPSTKQVVVSVLLAVSAALYMAFTIAAGKEFIKAAEYFAAFSKIESETENSFFTYAVPVSTFVFAAVALAVSVVQYCLSRKKPAGQAEEQIVEAETF